MTRDEVVAELAAYVVREVLLGDSEGLDERTPLLEWGVLNSMETLRLVAFIEERFGAVLAPDAITPATFRDLGAIADLVMACGRGAPRS